MWVTNGMGLASTSRRQRQRRRTGIISPFFFFLLCLCNNDISVSPPPSIAKSYCQIRAPMDFQPKVSMTAPAIIVESPKTTSATLIFFHEYNDTAGRLNKNPPNDWSVAHHIDRSPSLQHVKIIILKLCHPCIQIWRTHCTRSHNPFLGNVYESVELAMCGGMRLT